MSILSASHSIFRSFITSLISVCFVVMKNFFNRYIKKLLKSRNDWLLIWLSVKAGMGNRGTEWEEWWECGESGRECRESGWECEESGWECGELGVGIMGIRVKIFVEELNWWIRTVERDKNKRKCEHLQKYSFDTMVWETKKLI